MSIFEIIAQYKQAFYLGLKTTLKLCCIIWLNGIFIGSIIGFLSQKYKSSIGIFLKAISFILSSVPVLVMLFWIHYPFQRILNVSWDPFYTTVFTITLINIFTVREIVDSAIENLPKQYIEAAKVNGISSYKQIFHIRIPIISRFIMPSLVISQVNMLHLTLFGSLISVNEIFKISQQVNSQIYQPIEIYTALGIFFLLICLPLNLLGYYLKVKYMKNISEKQ